MEHRMIELEKRAAFQDQAIENLNQAVLAQDKKIERLEMQIKHMQRQVSEEKFVRPAEEEDPPPHY